MLAQRIEFVAANDVDLFASLPAAPAVFLLRSDESGSEPYISKTANLRRRLQRLLGPPTETTKKLNLRNRVRWIEFTPTGSDFESGFLLYKLLRSAFPRTYARRMRFRPAPLVKLHLENEYPRASVTTRLGRLSGRNLYYGPFPSRAAAEKFVNDSLDFFKVRRCVEDLHPDPKFPGCIYSEMKMCLAPCFLGCTDEQYHSEVERVKNYFDSRGNSLLQEITAERDQASAALEFETAAGLHARTEKIKSIASELPEIVHRIDRLSALIIQPSAVPDSVAFFRVQGGNIVGPIAFPIQSAEHAKSQSMESRVTEALQAFETPFRTVLQTMEHLAILKRWFYRGTRVGEIFFANSDGDLPLRRIVRGIARVYKGEKSESEETAPLNYESRSPS